MFNVCIKLPLILGPTEHTLRTLIYCQEIISNFSHDLMEDTNIHHLLPCHLMPSRIQQKPSVECMLWLRRKIQLQSTGDMWQRRTRPRPLNIFGCICEHLGALLPSRTIFVLGWIPHHAGLAPSCSFLLPNRPVCGWSHGKLKLNCALWFKFS